MNRKIEIHKRLGLSVEQTDNICDEVSKAFFKNGSIREVVEFVDEHYDSKSVLAGAVLNIITTKHNEIKQE